jgi:hypothetical protein
MADFDQSTYQPIDGDLYIQEVRTGRFTIYRYSFGSWEQLGAGHSEQDIKTLTEPLQLLGESKGFRRYYRPGEAKQPPAAEASQDESTKLLAEIRNDWRRLNNRLLVIQTAYPEAVKELLNRYDLVNEDRFEERQEDYLHVYYPFDTLSLALWFWLGAAKTCGLIERWIQ